MENYYLWKRVNADSSIEDAVKKANIQNIDHLIIVNKSNSIEAIGKVVDGILYAPKLNSSGRQFKNKHDNIYVDNIKKLKPNELKEINKQHYSYIQAQIKNYFYAKSDIELNEGGAVEAKTTITRDSPYDGDYALFIYGDKKQIALAKYILANNKWKIMRVKTVRDDVILNDISAKLSKKKGKPYCIVKEESKDDFFKKQNKAGLVNYFIVNVNEKKGKEYLFDTPITFVNPEFLKNVNSLVGDFAIISLPKVDNTPYMKAWGEFVSPDAISVGEKNILRKPVAMKDDARLSDAVPSTSNRIVNITEKNFIGYKNIIDNQPQDERNYYYALIKKNREEKDNLDVKLAYDCFEELEKPSVGDRLLVLEWCGTSAEGNSIAKFWAYCIKVDIKETLWEKAFEVEKKDLKDIITSFGKPEPATTYNDKPVLIEEYQYYQLLRECDPNLLALERCRNIVFNGAPGTGKTFMAKQIAQILGAKKKFVQFHPSYDYTDFVEGLRPVFQNNQQNAQANSANQGSVTTIGFERRDGIFKKFCAEAAENLAASMGEEIDWENGKFKENKIKEMPLEKFVFIIDEINRGDMSKIFGELFFSIEKGYRVTANNLSEALKENSKYTIQTQYQNLIKPGEPFKNGFFVPDNVYIIGTMNDIDRSVESMDFAMRRRFTFIEITPEEAKGMLYGKLPPNLAGIAVEKMDAINNIISKEIGPEFQIGPAYFLDLKDDSNFESLWKQRIEPLIKEYRRGEDKAETDSLLDKLKKAYDGNQNPQ